MRGVLILILGVFLGGGCASSPDVVTPTENGAETETVLEDDVVAKEVEEAITLEKMVDRLYTEAYDDYLTGNYENAISSFETAKILNSDKMEFWKKQALSYCYIATGRYKDAEVLSKELIQEKPDYWGAYFNAGLSALWQKKTKAALLHFGQALDFNDHEPAVDFYVGIARHLLGQNKSADLAFREAERAYQEIMKNNPEDEQAYIELAYLYLYRDQNLSKVEELLHQAKKLIENSDDVEKKQVWLDYYIPHLEGILYFKNKKFHRSILTLGGAIEKAPAGLKLDLAESYYYLAKNYQALKDNHRSQLFLRRATSLDPLVLYTSDIGATLKR